MPTAAPSPRSRPVLRRVHLLRRKRHRSSLRSSKSSSFSHPFPPLLYMLRSLLAVGCGCFVGGILRYLLTLLLPAPPMGVFRGAPSPPMPSAVLLIGLLSGWLSRIAAPDTLRLFLTVGLCGGFTTFSTFVGRRPRPLATATHAYRRRLPLLELIVGFVLLWLGHRLAA